MTLHEQLDSAAFPRKSLEGGRDDLDMWMLLASFGDIPSWMMSFLLIDRVLWVALCQDVGYERKVSNVCNVR